jgi:gamma-glutamyltranspeptidase / glutathione hydrolase
MIRNASPNYHEMLRRDPTAELFVRAPRAGELFRNPTLAATFRALAAEGKAGFYTGRVAQALVDVVQLCGGHLSMEDLKTHMEMGSQETTAVSLKFRGQGIANKSADGKGFVELWEHPPNGQGIVALMALGILEQLEASRQILTFATEDHNSVAYLHAVIESLRIAFADANWWVCDPDPPFAPPFSPEELVKPEYLKKRAELFSKDSICNPHHGEPGSDHGKSPAHNYSDTVYFSVTDAHGNGISFINSNYGGFGTCIIPAGCGFTLQNRGANFVLGPPDHPNIYHGGKRPYHTIIPALLTTGEAIQRQLLAVYGVMGGFMQPQGHVQVLLNMEVFGMNPQQALDAPRICVATGTPAEDKGHPETQGSSHVYIEEGIDDDVVAGLRSLGHHVTVLRGWKRGMFGRGQVIRQSWDDGGGREGEKVRIWSGGSDLRGDGCVMPA